MLCVVVGLILIFGFYFFAYFILNDDETSKIRLYISGPMSGYEDFNFPAFNNLAADIRDNFNYVEVVNPVDISKAVQELNPNALYEDYLREDFRELIDCDAVFLLEGWKDSGGCRKEVAVANALAIPCFETWPEFKQFVEENYGYKN